MNETNYNFKHQLNRHSSIPLHQQLELVLKEKIKDGTINIDEKLPSENELMGLFGVSRQVIRQCLTGLRHQGLIYTKHGLGSFVSPKKIDKSLAALQSFHKTMKESNLDINVEITTKAIVPTPELLYELLETDEPELFFLERVSYHDNVPISIVISYLSINNNRLDKLMNFSDGSLYEFLDKQFGISFHQSSNMIEVYFAQEYESQLLDVALGTPLLEISGQSYYNEKPMEYSRVIYPAAMVRFHFESHLKSDTNTENIYSKNNLNRNYSD